MKLTLAVILVFCSFCFTITITHSISLSKPGCPEKCGNITIPYPFGIDPNCSANSSFTLICNQFTNPPVLIITSIKMEVVSISLFGTIIVKQYVSPLNCSHVQTTQYLPLSLDGSLFALSAFYNSLAVLGCKNSVWLRSNQTATFGGCTALCDANSTDKSCNGVNCCQTTLPRRLKELQYTYKSNEASSNGSCGYVFPVDKRWLKNLDQPETGFVPLILEWEFGELKGLSSDICTYADDYCLTYPDDYGRREFKRDPIDEVHCSRSYHDSEYDPLYVFTTGEKKLYGGSEYYNVNYFRKNDYVSYQSKKKSDYVSSTKYCSCPLGFEGNPYLPKGCIDVDECSNSTLNLCPPELPTCTNYPGAYSCSHYSDENSDTSHASIVLVSTGSTLGGLVLLIMGWRSSKHITQVIKARQKRKFFKRNGGLLLEQHLSVVDSGLQKIKLFSSKEMTKATNGYNENRVLGRGGQGTVYKGMLIDGRIVAVKKSKKVEGGDLEVFINEVVILSQANHRNVVKLLGCCLETEVPLLVYEFVPNGTLFQHIHDPNAELQLTWEMRVRIAREVAEALAYLHSASSAPIYHRDIKSTNILLDNKCRAKIADFGTSRSISIDQTHLTCRVVGTFGYLDPEYFRSSQFTEKSDVYSFGVVMVELFTGEKAVSSSRSEEWRGLATHFLHSMKENQLFEILDARVLEEGKAEEIAAMAELARRCLHLNGKRRPTMKEVAHNLETIGSHCVQNEDDSIQHNFLDFAELDGISPLSETMDFDLLNEP